MTAGALVFLTWYLLPACLFGGRLLNSDGDPARHLAHGEWILAHGPIHRDPFSFTRPGEPFVGMEWGSQAVAALAHRIGGLPAVVLLSAAAIAIALTALHAYLRRRGVPWRAAYAATAAAGVLGAAHWVARPHLASQLGFVALLWLLAAVEDGRHRAAWLAVPLFAAWANLHGGWALGLVLLAAMLAGHLFRRASGRTDAAVAPLAAALALGAAATLATPYGTALHRHVAGFLGAAEVHRMTDEFQPPAPDDPASLLFGAAVLGLGVLAWRTRRLPTLPHALVILGTFAAALAARRHIPVFALTGFPLAVAAALGGRAPEPGAPRESPRRTLGWAAATLGLSVVTLPLTARLGVVPASFDPRMFPVAAVAEAREAGPGGHWFTEFTWGGYLLFARPGERVFIDPGTDFYGAALSREYLTILAAGDGWRERLERSGADRVLVPPDAPLAVAMARAPGWESWYRDSTAVLFLRTGATPAGAGR